MACVQTVLNCMLVDQGLVRDTNGKGRRDKACIGTFAMLLATWAIAQKRAPLSGGAPRGWSVVIYKLI